MWLSRVICMGIGWYMDIMAIAMSMIVMFSCVCVCPPERMYHTTVMEVAVL